MVVNQGSCEQQATTYTDSMTIFKFQNPDTRFPREKHEVYGRQQTTGCKTVLDSRARDGTSRA
jgi:hypothetical protein